MRKVGKGEHLRPPVFCKLGICYAPSLTPVYAVLFVHLTV